MSHRIILLPPSRPDALVDVRGPDSKHLYGRLDPRRMLLEVKRKGGMVEVIDLKALLERQPAHDK